MTAQAFPLLPKSPEKRFKEKGDNMNSKASQASLNYRENEEKQK